MDELISRQAAIDEVSNSIELCNKALDSLTLEGRDRYAVEVERNSLLELKDYIKLLPSAQPEIIACGDCKHWICHDRRCGYWNHGVKPLEWCCHAERRTDEQAD